MVLEKLVIVLTRVAGIFLLISVILGVLNFYYTYSQSGQMTTFVVIVGLLLLVTLFMIFKPALFASRLLPSKRIGEEQGETELIAALLVLATSLFGLYFLITAVLDLVYYGVYAVLPKIVGRSESIWTADMVAKVTETFIKLAAGIWLLFGASGLLKLIQWARIRHPDIKQ